MNLHVIFHLWFISHHLHVYFLWAFMYIAKSFSDMNSRECPWNWIWTFSGIWLSNMNIRVQNNPYISGLLRWVVVQTEAGCNVFIQLRRSRNRRWPVSPKTLLTSSSMSSTCMAPLLYSFRFLPTLHVRNLLNTPTHSWGILRRISCCVLTSCFYWGVTQGVSVRTRIGSALSVSPSSSVWEVCCQERSPPERKTEVDVGYEITSCSGSEYSQDGVQRGCLRSGLQGLLTQ